VFKRRPSKKVPLRRDFRSLIRRRSKAWAAQVGSRQHSPRGRLCVCRAGRPVADEEGWRTFTFTAELARLAHE
jgi:hypothetical protein